MKVVLINVKENFTPVTPLGILYIGTLLKKEGHEVRVFDANLRHKKETIKEIKNIDPDLIGFSSLTTSYNITKEFNKELKEQVPGSYYCWGGVHATAMPIQTIEENDLDFLVYGEGEITMSEICRRIKGKKKPRERGIDLKDIDGVYYFSDGEIRNTPPRPFIKNLDLLPIADRSLLDNFKWYLSPPGFLRTQFYYGITSAMTSRGCPHRCIFCASKIIHGSSIRRRDADNVIKEMVYLKQDFGVRGIYFIDDTFATNKDWLEDFCKSLAKADLNMVWGCQTRADIAQNLEILKIMKDSGCVQIDIGCESGSDRILEKLKKGITTETILKSFKNIRKLRIKTFASFIIGNPGETMEDIKKTLEIAKQAPPGGISFLLLVPYPGSPLYKMAIENDWFVNKNLVFDERWTNKESDTPVMEASFKADELVRIRARLQNMFFFKNNLVIMGAFLRSPLFLCKFIWKIAKDPEFLYWSIINAVKKRKINDLLENLYQKFNEY